jgi:hypothetical protein
MSLLAFFSMFRSERLERGGWPLLTVETEVIGNSKSTNGRGPSLVGLLGLACQYKRLLFCLVPWLLKSARTNVFFLTVYYFNSFVPIAQQAGQAAVLGRPSLTVVSISGLDSFCFLNKKTI